VIIFRYIAKEILKITLAITLLALVLFVTNGSVRFLRYAAAGGIPATEVLSLVALQIPLLLGYLIPLGFYLAVLLAFARLYMDSEMVVLAACGVSRAKIITMVLAIAFFVATIVFGLMVYALPAAQNKVGMIYQKAAAQASIAQITPGKFMVFDPGKNHIIFYAKKVEKNHALLKDVFLAKKNLNANNKTQESVWDVVVARQAYQDINAETKARYLVFDEGYRYQGVPGEKNYRVTKFKKMSLLIPSQNIQGARDDVSRWPFSKLFEFAKTNRHAAAEIQWRLAMPISTFLLALLAVPLSEIRPRQGKFTQLFPAVLIYLGLADGVLYSRGAIKSGHFPPWVGMWWVHLLVLILALLLIAYRANFFSRKRWRYFWRHGAC